MATVPQEEGTSTTQVDEAAAAAHGSVLVNGVANVAEPSFDVLNGGENAGTSDSIQFNPAQLSTDTSSTMAPIVDANTMVNGSNGLTQEAITADEIALYDRQIRLWGVKAQEKLRSARILLVGMKALATEIAKNLVLAGIGSLTILDPGLVTEEDLGAQFLVSEEQIGQNRAQAASSELQKLNPRVNLIVETEPIQTKPADYCAPFDITIATALDFDTLTTVNASCRISNRKFYAADTHGMYGYVFADLISHDFVLERTKANVQTPKPGTLETRTRTILSSSTKRESGKVTELVSKREVYSPLMLANTSPLPADITRNRRRKLQVSPLLSCIRALFEFQRQNMGRLPDKGIRQNLELFTLLANQKHQELLLPIETLSPSVLRNFLQNLGSEISPSAAYLGGALAQDVINVLGQRQQPLQNFLIFDGEECKAPIYSMHAIFDEELETQSIPLNNAPVENGSAEVNPPPADPATIPAPAQPTATVS
ncbi:MAG: hypothetical protein Q9160_006752 [Pyrenula sp. 1 TL-2023]